MERYDYKEEMKKDIREYLDNNMELPDYDSKDDAYEKLYEDMWVNDDITGNGSGSYTFSTWEAEENLCHNWDLLNDAFLEFGLDENVLDRGAEYLDVTIRCYLLGECLSEVLDESAYNDVWE